MKSKGSGKAKNKGSLQKTSSTIINLHTHRNSIISQTLPFYYNDSVASIRACSLYNSKQNELTQEKNKKTGSVTKLKRKKLVLKDQSQNQIIHPDYFKQNYLKSRRSNPSRQKVSNKGIDMTSQNTKICKKSAHFSDSFNPDYNLTTESAANLGQLLKKSKNLLENYRVYTQQLQLERNRYKQKYKQVLIRLKKSEAK